MRLKQILLAFCVMVTSLVATSFTAAPVMAAVITKPYDANFTDDTQGLYGALNPEDAKYGVLSTTPSGRDKVIVPLVVPTATQTKPSKVKYLVIKMHDHYENGTFTFYGYGTDGVRVKMGNSGIDVKTEGDPELCGILDRIHSQHDISKPANVSLENYCSHTHIIQINSDLVRAELEFGNQATTTQKPHMHYHIGAMTWYIDEDDSVPPPVAPPAPTLQAACIAPNQVGAADHLKISWAAQSTPVQVVNLSDSTAASRWNSTNGYFWNKVMSGQTSTTGTGGFAARGTATGTLALKPNTTYHSYLWNGTQAGPVSSITITQCEVPPGSKPTGTIGGTGGVCVPRTQLEPLQYTITLSNIDTKGTPFYEANFLLSYIYNAQTAKIMTYLGNPIYATWKDQGRAARDGDRFSYSLQVTNAQPQGGQLSFTWKDQLIGGTNSNWRKLADLVAYIRANSLPTSAEVGAYVSAGTSPVGLIRSEYIAGFPVDLSPLSCTKDEPICQPGNPNCTIPCNPGEPGCPNQCVPGTPGCPNPVCIVNTTCAPAPQPQCGAPIYCSYASDPATQVPTGNSCPATDVGPPNAPIILTPGTTDRTLTLNEINQATILWQQATPLVNGNRVSKYEIVIFPQNSHDGDPQIAFDLAASNPTSIASTTQAAVRDKPAIIYAKTITIPTALAQSGEPLMVAIRSLNEWCGGEQTSEWTPVTDVTITGSITGTVYLAPSCTDTSTPYNVSGRVELTGDSFNQTLNNESAYTINNIPGGAKYYLPELSLSQAMLDNGLRCSACNTDSNPGVCNGGQLNYPTDNTRNFFVQLYDLSVDSWWQARGGLVYGHTGITSGVPFEDVSGACANSAATATGKYCEPYLVRSASGANDKTAGIPMTRDQINDLQGWYTQRETSQTHAANGADNYSKVTKENYEFFASKFNFDGLDNSPNSVSNVGQLKVKTVGGENTQISRVAGNLTINPTETWQIGSTEKRIIFVEGNITFVGSIDRLTEVAQGGFLAFIAKGDITFDRSVGYTNPTDTEVNQTTDPNITGVFIANGQVIVDTTGAGDDKKFIGAGTYVGWSGVQVKRTFDNGALGKSRNTTTPTELFVFRPDFVTSAPDLLRFTDLVWQQVN